MNNPKSIKKLSTVGLLLLLALALVTTAFRFEPSLGSVVDTGFVPIHPAEAHSQLSYLGGSDDGNAVDVIRNGGFELRDTEGVAGNDIALEWDRFSNGRAHLGWYDDLWPEVVHSGEHAQLMEIKEIYGDFRDRVMAIHQTVDVVPNAEYDLTMYVILRSESQPNFRNRNDFEMSWGVDLSGSANYDNVDEWMAMPLTEQFRMGSSGPEDDDAPLFYETITGTVRTNDTGRLTLYIQGLKRWPTTTEVLFNVDDVSLVGPKSVAAAPATSTTSTDTAPAAESSTTTDSTSAATTSESTLPVSGAAPSNSVPAGIVVLGGIFLVILSGGAVANLLLRSKDH